MNVEIKARHMDVTDAIRDYGETKLAKLPRFYNKIQSMEMILDFEAEKALAEVVVTAKRKATFVGSERNDDMYAAIDQAVHKVEQQIRRHKDRVRDHQGPPHEALKRETL
ncbi:MAG: ribosome-associated translation inhibitor RaiA [Phycisphaerae bacterium]|nr:ribosome-associated translation inhibitor RaiA [Phycisphaerae bacterium]